LKDLLALAVFDTAVDGIIVIDDSGTIEALNRAPTSSSARNVDATTRGTFLRHTIGVLLLLVGAVSTSAQTRPPVATATADLSTLSATTTRTVSPSVVEILTTAQVPGEGVVPRPSDLVATRRGTGSGVIVDPDGYIVTNAHVVQDAQQLRVEIPVVATGRSILSAQGRMVKGTVVGIDLETDLAVIKVDERNLAALPFGDSDELSAGQIVLALGSPLGLQSSVSLGVVSAVARQLEPESPMIYVQTDAAINPGSSGGPLVDLRGRLMGINTLIASQAGGFEGLGFAAPSNIVRSVYEQIRKFGRVRRGEIGVRIQSLTPVLATGLGLKQDRGAILADVLPESPAARAGLLPGDVVVMLDTKPIENGRQLQVNLYRRAIGESVLLEVLRKGQLSKVSVTIAERFDPGSGVPVDPRDNLVSRLGILAVNLDQRVARMVPVVRVSSGVVVASAVANAIPARDGGLIAGDVIFAVNQTAVSDIATLRQALASLKAGDPAVLHIERRGSLMFVAFTIE
jgi:serine protease Do